jgi:hypothetical protein
VYNNKSVNGDNNDISYTAMVNSSNVSPDNYIQPVKYGFAETEYQLNLIKNVNTMFLKNECVNHLKSIKEYNPNSIYADIRETIYYSGSIGNLSVLNITNPDYAPPDRKIKTNIDWTSIQNIEYKRYDANNILHITTDGVIIGENTNTIINVDIGIDIDIDVDIDMGLDYADLGIGEQFAVLNTTELSESGEPCDFFKQNTLDTNTIIKLSVAVLTDFMDNFDMRILNIKAAGLFYDWNRK